VSLPDPSPPRRQRVLDPSPRRRPVPLPFLAAPLLALLTLSLPSPAGAQVPPDLPFEPAPPGVPPLPPPPPFAPFRELSLALVERYQETAAPVSVARCPFALSCSALAHQALHEQGLSVALIRFVDRFFFRENAGTPDHYQLRRAPGGRLLLDDEHP
jgi:hypothetical protein